MREQLDFSRKGSSGFALILPGFVHHLVLFALNLYALALDVEAQAVEDRDVLIRDPDQGKEAENRAAPILIHQPVVRDQQETSATQWLKQNSRGSRKISSCVIVQLMLAMGIAINSIWMICTPNSPAVMYLEEARMYGRVASPALCSVNFEDCFFTT